MKKMSMRSILSLVILLAMTVLADGKPAPDSLRYRLQTVIDSIRQAESWPGLTLAVELPDGRRLSLASGWADREAQVPMRPGARMMVGSVGKIFVAPLVLQLAEEQQLDLDTPIRSWLGTAAWFEQLPNAGEITLRMLLNHSSGLPRYIFTEGFLAAAKAEPMKEWRPEDLLSFVFDMAPVHEAGKGWAYSDTNYIILGMLLERWAGKPYYQLLDERIVRPYSLTNTIPSDRRDLPGLTQGYIGEENFMNLPAKVVSDGKYAMNPQFEWTGGGLVSNAVDLAYWLKEIHQGDVIPAGLYQPMISAVDFRTGQPATAGYGLGTFVWPTPHGLHYGHSGLFMGYLTIAEYSAEHGFSIALQTNTDATLGRSMHRHALHLSRIIVESLAGKPKER